MVRTRACSSSRSTPEEVSSGASTTKSPCRLPRPTPPSPSLPSPKRPSTRWRTRSVPAQPVTGRGHRRRRADHLPRLPALRPRRRPRSRPIPRATAWPTRASLSSSRRRGRTTGSLRRSSRDMRRAISDSNGLDTADPDPDANYGTVPSLATSDCLTATDDCFQFQFQNIPRPSQHWDTYFDETLSTSDPHHRWAKRWTVHAGLSFADVSPTSSFYPFVEDIFHNGITGGCGAGVFCPTNPVTRAQMSVFLLKAKHGKSYVPPRCTPGVFADVPCPSLFADWIEELAAETITAGCGGADFCPDDRRHAAADGGVSPEGADRIGLHAAGLHGHLRRRRLPEPVRQLGRGPSTTGRSPPAAARARCSTARRLRTSASRWPSS